MRNLHKPFVRSRRWNRAFDSPPGELSRAAKRCLIPKGDEKCLAIIRFTSAPSLTASRVQTRQQIEANLQNVVVPV
jgi:hypothetical protein